MPQWAPNFVFPGFVPFVLHTLKKNVHTMSPVRFWILNIASAFLCDLWNRVQLEGLVESFLILWHILPQFLVSFFFYTLTEQQEITATTKVNESNAVVTTLQVFRLFRHDFSAPEYPNMTAMEQEVSAAGICVPNGASSIPTRWGQGPPPAFQGRN